MSDGLRAFGKLTAAAIEANVGPAHDAALNGEEYHAGQPGIWSVDSVLRGTDTAPQVVIRIYAG